ncbi:MAG: hypothetical protein P0S95_02165 [Rhabdochlamydiaceae bacterium]|nr:hypothetical protein [Candidatus Amphrikana amoebophyrae]
MAAEQAPSVGNFEQNMIVALQGYVSAINNAIVVDGEGSSPVSFLLSDATAEGRAWLSTLNSAIQKAAAGSALSKAQVAYNQANSTINNVEQQCSNLTQKATNDVNNDSTQSQEALSMASTIINGVGFFNNLLSQAFPS